MLRLIEQRRRNGRIRCPELDCLKVPARARLKAGASLDELEATSCVVLDGTMLCLLMSEDG